MKVISWLLLRLLNQVMIKKVKYSSQKSNDGINFSPLTEATQFSLQEMSLKLAVKFAEYVTPAVGSLREKGYLLWVQWNFTMESIQIGACLYCANFQRLKK